MKFNDLSGQKFNHLLVIKRSQSINPNCKLTYYECLCDCGNICIIYGCNLTKSKSKTCGIKGCEYYFELCGNRLTHGKSKSDEHSIYSKMISRCYNQKNSDYPSYGGRGISVCDSWRLSFMNFFNDMGIRPSKSHSIDRIDNQKGYSLDNCRWALPKDQARNRRSNTFTESLAADMRYDHDVNKLTARQISNKYNIPDNKINYIRDIIKGDVGNNSALVKDIVYSIW